MRKEGRKEGKKREDGKLLLWRKAQTRIRDDRCVCLKETHCWRSKKTNKKGESFAKKMVNYSIKFD
jgi:hypothetical protein